MRGKTTPRLFTPPARRLTRHTTRGYEVAGFADMIGEPLLPWQDWLVKHALELNRDGTFRFRVVLVLVARQNGKTSAKRTTSLWRLYVDRARLVLGVAQDVALAREVWNGAIATIHATPDLAAELDYIRRVNGDEHFRLTSGGRYKIAASNRRAARGLSVDELNIDELREQRDWDAWSALSKTTSAKINGQIWAMSNAGDDESVVLNQLREAALAGRDPSIFLAEWSAEDGCDLDDPKAWAQANPALAHIMGEQAIRSALGTDPPNVFRTEVLCQRVANLDTALDPAAWRDCADPTGTLDSYRDRVVTCVEVAPDGEHVTLAAAAVLDDGRVRVEIVKAWSSTDEARDELGPLIDTIRPRARSWYPTGPAAALAPILRTDDTHELKGGQVIEACMGLADLTTARRILHPDDPLLNTHIAAAQKLYQGDGWRFTRRGSGHVDAAYAAAGAIHTALTVPIKRRIRPTVIAGKRAS
jgi:hypothetical protein